MGVAQRHRDILMSHQFLDGGKVYPTHYQPTGKRMPEIVEGEIGNRRSFQGSSERGSYGPIRLA